MKIFLISFSIIFLYSTYLFGQSSCERNLNEARANYTNGNLYAVSGKLDACLKDGFTKTEQIEALRLLTLTYININQQEKARETFIKLLNIQTDFQVTKNEDPSELYSLYNDIDTDVKYYIGLTVGGNVNTIRVHEQRNSIPVIGDHDPNYSPKLALPQIGIQFLYPYTKNLIAGAEIQYQNQRFGYSETNYSIDGNRTDINYEATTDGINLNFMARYQKDYYKWKPFVELGSTFKGTFTYEILEYTNNFIPTVDDEIIINSDILSDRVKFNLGLNLNLGTMFKAGEYYGEVKVGATNFFRNHLTPEARLNALENTLLDGMILKDDDYSNIIYHINVSFNIPFFDFK